FVRAPVSDRGAVRFAQHARRGLLVLERRANRQRAVVRFSHFGSGARVLTMSKSPNATRAARAFAHWLVREARRYRALIVLWLVYEASQLVFFYLSRRQGLLQGVSVVSFGVLAFGAFVLLLRIAVLFYLPLALISRVARRLWLGESAQPSASSEHV